MSFRELIPVKKGESLYDFDEQFPNSGKMTEKTAKVAFVGLLFSMMREPFMSGDTKAIVIYGMMNIVNQSDLSEEEYEYLSNCVEEVQKFFNARRNSFMG
jgi:hypothetical protein